MGNMLTAVAFMNELGARLRGGTCAYPIKYGSSNKPIKDLTEWLLWAIEIYGCNTWYQFRKKVIGYIGQFKCYEEYHAPNS